MAFTNFHSVNIVITANFKQLMCITQFKKFLKMYQSILKVTSISTPLLGGTGGLCLPARSSQPGDAL